MKKMNLSMEELTNEETAAFIIDGLKKYFSEGSISEMASVLSGALEVHGKHWRHKTNDDYYEDILRLHNIWEDIYNQTVTGSIEELEDQAVKFGAMTPKQVEENRLKRGIDNVINEDTSNN